MVTRASLHTLIDEIPDDLLGEAERHLLPLARDPLWQAFMRAPEDDEPLTKEDMIALWEAREDRAKGLLIPL